jgi:phage tail sheath protein FI
MAFQLSPGVNFSEIDLTTVVPAVATTDGAIGGVFRWGPIGERTLVDSENILVQRFGKPTNHNAETFFTAANFLAYGNRLYVSRAAKTSGSTPANVNFVVTGNSTVGNTVLVGNTTGLESGMYITQTTNTTAIPSTGTAYAINSVNSTAVVLAKAIFPATVGAAGAANSNLNFARLDTTYTAVAADASETAVITANLVHQIVKNENEYNNKDGSFDPDLTYVARYPGEMGNSLRISVCDTSAGFNSNIGLTAGNFEVTVGSPYGYIVSNSATNTAVNTAFESIAVGDYILTGNSSTGQQYLLVTGKSYSQDTTSNVAFGISGSNGGINQTTGFISINNLSGSNLVFNVGDIVVYSNTTGAATGGLSSGSSYYITEANTTAIKISATRDGSAAISGAAAGTAHKFLLDVNKLTLSFQDPYRLRQNFYSNTVQRYWEFFNAVETPPGQSDYVRLNGNTSANDELHVVVVDDGGAFTGTPGTILEVYKGVSRATDSKNNDGSTNYYKDVINDASLYIWWANDRSNAYSNNALNVASATTTAPANMKMRFGADGLSEETATLSVLGAAYDLFVSPEDIDISLVMQGKPIGGTTVVGGETISNFQLANYIIDNICEVRKDCVALVSPDKSKVLNNIGAEALSLKNWRGAIRNTSYAVLDSGYKYQYDRYNDIYRWVPLNGDIAGLCVRTDNTNDAWWSPAGFNRGNVKNVVKLAWNPRKAERDILYSNGVNPVVTFPGQGTVLFGDKTLQAKPSAFDRINVRRLFIVLEKAISTAAKFSLFEFNDAFTRAQFKNLVTPYLRNIQGRRGITDFLVICDETNNTAQVIDSNQFVGDIYIKPARSINFIQLNFVAVGTGVQFSEVVGKF